MNKEELLNKITGYESEIKIWKEKSETSQDPNEAKAANMDLQRVKRQYKRLLMDLGDADCDEIKALALQNGVRLEFFDELNCPEEEKKRIKAEQEAAGAEAERRLQEYYKAHPEAEQMTREALAEDSKALFEMLEPKKKKKGIFGGLFGGSSKKD